MRKLLIAGLALTTVAGAALPAAAATADNGRGRAERSWDRNDRSDRQDRREDRRDDRQERRDDRREGRQDAREDRREFRQDRREDWREFRQDAREDRRDFRHDQRRYQRVYVAPRGYVDRSWSRGQYMPRPYYSNQSYVIRDYNRYGLYAPPAGYQWVQSGNDAVLVAIASGLIGALIGGLFF